MDKKTALKKIKTALKVKSGTSLNINSKTTEGTIYEVFVLSQLIQDLKNYGGTVSHISPNGKDFKLKTKGSPLNKGQYSYFKVCFKGGKEFEIHLDTYFSTQSFHLNNPKINFTMSDATIPNSYYHELDIVVIEYGSVPDFYCIPYNKILLTIECKHIATTPKRVLREALGYRREMTMFQRKNIKNILRLALEESLKDVNKINNFKTSPKKEKIPYDYLFDFLSCQLNSNPPSLMYLICIDQKSTLPLIDAARQYGLIVKHLPTY